MKVYCSKKGRGIASFPMADEITNIMLLRYLERMKADLERQIAALDQKLSGRIDGLEVRMNQGFEEARQHRQALQEDLEATMRMLAKHDRKLAKM